MQIAILAIISLAAAHAVDLDLYAFGLSRHSNRNLEGGAPNERNPGFGVGLMLPASPCIEVGAVAGWYMDSEYDRARFLMPQVRATAWNRLSLDVAAGYFHGSCFDGFGGVATAGLRIAGPVWVHGVYVPSCITGVGYGVALGFLRFRM